MGYLFTKFVLKKPVTMLIVSISVIFFGFISITSFKYELMPSMSMPAHVVFIQYPGAQPEDVDENIVRKAEEKFYSLKGLKNLQGQSMENAGILALQYNYGQNMDKAYNDLKKACDQVRADFPDAVKEPVIYEMENSQQAVMKLAVRNKSGTDIYTYVNNVLLKDLQRINDVAQAEMSGGRENYISIKLKPDMMSRYNLSMSTIQSIVANAHFTMPGGDVKVGERELSFNSGIDYKTVESLKTIPIVTGNKGTLYLEDIAEVSDGKKKASSFGRYDMEDCIVVSISKSQEASTVSLSKEVRERIDELMKQDANLDIRVISDAANNINSSIHNVYETMVIAIVLSMIIIWIFLGDIKASLIVGTSIPFSILTSFVFMKLAGYTLNVITLSALVLGVGMMVDNSIVVLEACFRAGDEFEGEQNLAFYCLSALKAGKTIGASVFGSTLTTVVVFAPLGFLQGMSGQFFKPLGFTIVFCMIASYFSAMTVVPLTYVLLKPKEKTESLASGILETMQSGYRTIVGFLLDHKIIVTIVSIAFVIFTFMLLPSFKTELVAETDNDMIQISITTKPGLSYDAKDKIYKRFEEFVKAQPEVEHQVLSNSAGSMDMSGGGGQSIIAFLYKKETRKGKQEATKTIVSRWKKEFSDVADCTVDVKSYSDSSLSGFVRGAKDNYEVILEASDYQRLKDVNDRIVKLLEQRTDCGSITTSLDNSAPLIKAEIDPILAAAEGYAPRSVGALLYNMLSGVKVMDKTIDGNTREVRLEYDTEEYDTAEKVANIELTSANGTKTMVKDIAKIYYKDNPARIGKYNKKYRTTIRTYLNENATENTATEIEETIIKPQLNQYINIGENTIDKYLAEEFTELGIAIAIATFLVFAVMASQFESLKFSLMVMGTVLFSFSGGLLALWLTNLKLQMVVLLGMLMLIGTAVNNGILYIDTVNQFLNDGKDLRWALIESGAIRLRPILMTTLTTIVSMIPMSLAYGENGETLQGLAVVDVGGLVVSTLMALLVLPVLYYLIGSGKRSKHETLRSVGIDSVTDFDETIRLKELANLERRRNEKKNS